MLIAQITDFHITAPGTMVFGEVDTAAQLSAAVTYLNGLSPRPDLVVATGDLTNSGRQEEYAHLRQLLAPLQIPIYLLPGNHDDRNNLRAAFPHHTYLPAQGDLHWVLDEGPLTIVGIDSKVAGQPGGNFSVERAVWLDRVLRARKKRPTLLFMHHPPFLTGQEQLDNVMCFGSDRLGVLVSQHPQVESVMCGHHHQAIITRWAGITAGIAPATSYQIAVESGPDSAAYWVPAPASCMLHSWHPGTGLMSRIVITEAFASDHRDAPVMMGLAAE